MAWEDAKDVKIVTKNFGVADSHKLSVYNPETKRTKLFDLTVT